MYDPSIAWSKDFILNSVRMCSFQIYLNARFSFKRFMTGGAKQIFPRAHVQLMAKWKASETKHKDAISQLYRELEDARSSAAAREHDLQVQITQLRAHLGGASTDRSECSAYRRVRAVSV